MAVLVRIHVEESHRPSGAAQAQADVAFEVMYRRCHGDLVALCRSLLGRTGDPEATAQDAFLRAWLARDRYSPVKPFWPWLAMIARRLCLDHRRRAMRELAGTQLMSERDVHIDPPEVTIEASEDLRTVVLAMRDLRESELRALLLREFDGWSYKEIATFEGVTVESVRGTLKRARASLRAAVRAQTHPRCIVDSHALRVAAQSERKGS